MEACSVLIKCKMWMSVRNSIPPAADVLTPALEVREVKMELNRMWVRRGAR